MLKALESICVPALKFAVSMVFPFTRNEITRSTIADAYGLPWDGDYSVPITGAYTPVQSQSSEQDEAQDIPLDDTRTDDWPSDGFDIAFGIDKYLFGFARTFTERLALHFMQWPPKMTTLPNGQPVLMMIPRWFKAEFDTMMGLYLSLVPDGRFKFNLGGMDNCEPYSLTTWELETISTSSIYSIITDYYEYTGSTRVSLTESEARIRITSILD